MAEGENALKFDSENEILKRNDMISFLIHKAILTPPTWLEGLESVFKWGKTIRKAGFVTWNIRDKLNDYENQGAFYGFERLSFLLTLLFLKTYFKESEKVVFVKRRNPDGEEGEEGSQEESDPEEENDPDKESNSEKEEEEDEYDPEKCYVKCMETVDEMANNEGDVMYSRIGPILQHVLQATRAHMLFYSGKEAESQELARNMQPVEEMSPECKAGLEGLKAKVVMSMVQKYTIVLPYLDKAIELDPKFGYWPYLYGKVLRRARREFDEGTIDEELNYFEKAVSLERNPKFLVFLAQAYQETATSLVHSRGRSDSLDRLYQRAVDVYRSGTTSFREFLWSRRSYEDSVPGQRKGDAAGSGLSPRPSCAPGPNHGVSCL